MFPIPKYAVSYFKGIFFLSQRIIYPIPKDFLSCFKGLCFCFTDERQQASRQWSVTLPTLVGKGKGWCLLVLFTVEPGKESVDNPEAGMEPSVRTRGFASKTEQELAVAVSF